jgi:single-strand DNA-binding protein
MNQCNLIGRLGKDVDVRTVSEKKVGNFSLAIDMGYGDKKTTVWFNCALWDKDKIYEFLKKGTQVFVSGEVSVRTWESNGKHGASLELRVFQIQLLGGKQEGQESTTAAPAAAKPQQSEPSYQDESPF